MSEKRYPVRRLLAKLTLAVVSLGVFGGAAEVLSRRAGYAPKDYFQWVGHPDLDIAPLPDQQTWFGRDRPETGETLLPIRINHYGERGEDYPLQKPAGEVRIAVVGDSLTMGQGVRDAEAYPAQLDQILAERGTGSFRVINAGVNHWTSWHYKQWALTQLERHHVDVLVVGLFTGNDMLLPPRAPLSLVTPFASSLRNSAFYRFLATQYRDYLWKRVSATRRGLTPAEIDQELLQYAGIRPSSLSHDDQRFLWERHAFGNMTEIRDVAERQGVRFAIFLLPTSSMTADATVSPTYEWISQSLRARGIPVIEALERMRAAELAANPSIWLPWDRGHLAPSGNRLAAEILESGLAETAVLP